MTAPAVGFLATLLAGLTMGLLGAGGSLLTVPILVYLFGFAVTQATGYSLFIVGATSLVGALVHWRRGLVCWRTGGAFAVPSLFAVYATRRWLLPALPPTLWVTLRWSISLDRVLMLLFALLMAVAASAMIWGGPEHASTNGRRRYELLFTLGLVVGALAGLLGAGGGFLIIPCLVLFAGMPIRQAVGTSLAIVAAQSLLGFCGVLQTRAEVDWRLLGELTAVAYTGLALGLLLGRYLPSGQLRAAFGWFVLAVGAGIFVEEVLR